MQSLKLLQMALLVAILTVLFQFGGGAITQAQTPKKNTAKVPPPQTEWIQLFNGKDLTGWTAKIRGHELGDNYADTFRVVDGNLVVSYEDYTPEDSMSVTNPKKKGFDKFGHLFYKDKFSHYVLRAEYRFVGDQIANGPRWARRNNGLMIHGQDPATMTKDQMFPASIEVQLRGGWAPKEKPQQSTLNLCTPGTNVVMDGKLYKPHVFNSSASIYEGDQWVTVEVEVLGSEVVRHRVEGQTVMEYNQPQLDPKDNQAFPMSELIKDGKLLLEEGTISIQSESAPTEFRKIELRVLEP